MADFQLTEQAGEGDTHRSIEFERLLKDIRQSRSNVKTL